jgi:integrase
VLQDYLLKMPTSDNPDTPIFPRAARLASQTRSNQFADILAAAGLQKARTHEKTDNGEGRNAERKASRLSFHCLRHTATSLLKNAGVSNVVAMEIIGHDSEAVSRIYTHIESDTLRDALNKMPDLVKDLPAQKKPATKGAK